MRIPLTLLLLVSSLVSAVSVARAAEEVVLVHPAGADPFVQEIFHRVGGELRIHSFSIRQEEEGPSSPSLPVAEALLARTHADACVFLGWQGDTSVVHVWVAAAGGPPALFEAVALQRTSDVPTMLAARAVDLLTAGLDAKNRPRPRTADATPAVPVLEKTAGTPAAAAEPTAARWSIDLGPAMLADVSKFGAAWGPQLVLGRRTSRRLEFAARVAGPFVGAQHANSDASADLVQAFALAEVVAVLTRGEHLTLRAGGGGGTYYVRATGSIPDGISSIVPGHDDQWTLAGAVVADATLNISSRVFAVWSAQTLFLAPRPRVAVGREQAHLQEPLLALALSIRFAF